MDDTRLLNLKEVSRILNVNTEVLRRWLRSKKMPGVKVGSDWRVREKDLDPFLNPQPSSSKNPTDKNQSRMCFRFPKWLEFSGLPKLLNTKYGPEAWPVFKKLIEVDFEQGKPRDRKVIFSVAEISERVGYSEEKIIEIFNSLQSFDLINFSIDKKRNVSLSIVTPIKTPKLVLDISFEKGGVKGAPSQALKNNCLRRYLEADESAV
jgi:excisionase family DNA binding protein